MKEVNSPFIQRVGEDTYKINLETTASQVSMADGSSLETKIAALSDAISGQTSVYIVEDIAARDALENVKVGDQVWVKDATGDPSVTSGAAKYLYEGGETGWVKTAEAEDMDVQVNWEDVVGRPTHTVEEIDNAVTQGHTHVNKTAVLDELDVDENDRLLFKGEPVKSEQPVYQGATLYESGVAGLVPPANSLQRESFLRGDGTWVKVTELTPDPEVYVNKAIILSPTMNQEFVVNDTGIYVETNPFSVLLYNDTHAATGFKICNDSAGLSTIVEVETGVDTTSYTFTPEQCAPLVDSSMVYVFARHKGATLGYGPWSDPIAIRVARARIITPSISSPATGETLYYSDGLTVQSSAFECSRAEDTLANTEFKICSDSSGQEIMLAATSTTTSYNFSSEECRALLEGPAYIFVRHRGTRFGLSSWSSGVSVTLKQGYINTPEITSPAAGTDVYVTDGTMAVTSSAFTTSPVPDTHASTDWKITLDANGTQVLKEDLNSSDLTAHTFTGLEVNDNQVVYLWVRYHGAAFGVSEWSAWTNVVCKKGYVNTPGILSPTANADVYITDGTLTVTASAFSSYPNSDTHVSTDWKLTSDAAGTQIIKEDLNSGDLTTHTFTGLTITDNQAIYIWARYNGRVFGTSAWSAGVHIVGKKAFINTPSIVSPSANAQVLLSVVAVANAFNGIGDTHASTDWRLSRDAAGTDVVASAYGSSDLTSHEFDLAPRDAGQETFYISCKYNGHVVASGWSAPVAIVQITDDQPPFRLTAATASNNKDYFAYAGSSAVDASNFTVYINDQPTNQSYRALTFAASDRIVIRRNNLNTVYPVMHMIDGIRSIDGPFPTLYTQGQKLTNTHAGNTGKSLAGYNLVSIPEDLFINNPQITSFSYCFSGCSVLTQIPAGLFAHNPDATSFYECFGSCASITSIPENLFVNNTKATGFSLVFYYATNLATIPQNLFKYNTKATSFYQSFYNCHALKSVPANLFYYNTKATSFDSCFYESGLTSIPSGLFDRNTLVTEFTRCFSYCTDLTTIPPNLFQKNTAVTDFGSCFSGCRNLNSVTLTIGSRNVNSAYYFGYSTNKRITVRAPAGSTSVTDSNSFKREADEGRITLQTY